jgi:hypothetical protein
MAQSMEGYPIEEQAVHAAIAFREQVAEISRKENFFENLISRSEGFFLTYRSQLVELVDSESSIKTIGGMLAA